MRFGTSAFGDQYYVGVSKLSTKKDSGLKNLFYQIFESLDQGLCKFRIIYVKGKGMQGDFPGERFFQSLSKNLWGLGVVERTLRLIKG